MTGSDSFQILVTAIGASAIAQILKFFGYLIIHRRMSFTILTTTGGMPSAHSAAVVGLAAMVGFKCGFDSAMFAVSCGYAMIVMYDAAGLRRSAGKIASTLNKVIDDMYSQNQTNPYVRLKELLGHTPLEVVIGALLGIGVAYVNFHYVF